MESKKNIRVMSRNKQIKEIRLRKKLERKKKIRKLQEAGWKVSHLQMVIYFQKQYTISKMTVLYQRINDTTIKARFAFCSPLDNFDKTEGWIQAEKHREFIIYHVPQKSIFSIVDDFLNYLLFVKPVTEIYGWEQQFHIPRWYRALLPKEY